MAVLVEFAILFATDDHSQEQHQTEAVKKLEIFNAAKEIARLKKRKAVRSLAAKQSPQFPPQSLKTPHNFSVEEIEGKAQQIN